MGWCGECGRHVMGGTCKDCRDPVRVYRDGTFVEEVRRILDDFSKKPVYYKGKRYACTWEGYAGVYEIEIGEAS